MGSDLRLGRGGRGGGPFGAMGGTSSKSLMSGELGGLGEELEHNIMENSLIRHIANSHSNEYKQKIYS